MNCWEILGIEPTRDNGTIRDAYEHQRKFAEGDDARLIEQAYRQALVEVGHPAPGAGALVQPENPEPQAAPVEPAGQESGDDARHQDESLSTRDRQADDPAVPLSASDQQVVREVVIQVQAMLNDSIRRDDVAIWRAILTESPADQDGLRSAVGRELEPELRPLADDALLAPPVARFLEDWFGWYGMTDALEETESEQPFALDDAGRFQGTGNFPGTDADGGQDSEPGKRQMVNFWPAVIGWIIGLIILASLFGGLSGG